MTSESPARLFDRAVSASAVALASAASATLSEQAGGAYALIATTAVLLIAMRRSDLLLPYAAAALGALQLSPIAISWIDGSLLGLPLASGTWLVAATLPAAVLALGTARIQGVAAVAVACMLTFVLLALARQGDWLNPETLTAPGFRIALPAIANGLALFLFGQTFPVEWKQRLRKKEMLGSIAAITGTALAVSLLTPTSPVRGVVFNEAHGRWATVEASYTPTDFGRSVSYTYSLLAQYADRLTGEVTIFREEGGALPPTDRVFVLKMPSDPISAAFSSRLAEWVNRGGKLLIVADHTDLYDHAQHLNRFLETIGRMRIAPSAVYNAEGRPNRPLVPVWTRFLGRIDAHGYGYPWLTGTDATRIPLSAVTLADYGPGFIEPGDYGRPNRFGPFLPRTSLPYGNVAGAFAFAHGQGAIAVVLDSTPWSNFSMFREEYRRLFRGVIGTLQESSALRFLGWFMVGLLPLSFAAAMLKHLLARLALAISLGVVLGAGWRVADAGTEPLTHGRDYTLRVVTGPQTQLGFMPQLIGPGERNYARVVSSMAKYGLDPIAQPPGSAPGRLSSSERWLFIEPSVDQLPPANAVLTHLRSGRHMAVFFAPDAAAEPRVRAWLLSLDLALGPSTAFAISEDAWRTANGAFSARRGSAAIRDVRTITLARSDGLMKEHAFDRLWQTYTVRPTTLPRTSGLLVVGFSADQIADSAIGDVWEGVRPSALGALRERQIGLLLRGEDAPGPWPDNLQFPPRDAQFEGLRHFLVSEDGRLLLEGELAGDPPPEAEMAKVAYAEDPLGYLADLRARAIGLVRTDCPANPQGIATVCSHRLLSLDGTEWLVTRRDIDGRLRGIELLHERRWSGLGANINIVFAD
jgi:hypothetical protein